jgi:SAM-dependent methyltransferase
MEIKFLNTGLGGTRPGLAYSLSGRGILMLHRKRVAIALYYAFRRRIRVALGIPARPKPPPVLGHSLEYAVKWHSSILDGLMKHLPQGLEFTGKNVCEVGAGDCLATSAFFLARGARHVDVIEMASPVINERQKQVLEILKWRGYPVDLTILRQESASSSLRLDKRVTYHHTYMENFQTSTRFDFIFSNSVMEHVEDLAGFYVACWRTLTSGGQMLHLIDLGGHELFEDPLPPLDFQTYPDWLYNAMYPKYYRATRRFLSEHADMAKAAGFTIEQLTPTRTADDNYVDELWPRLRSAARQRPREEIRVVEFALLAGKS